MHQSFASPATVVDLGVLVVPPAMINGGVVVSLLLMVLGTRAIVDVQIVTCEGAMLPGAAAGIIVQ